MKELTKSRNYEIDAIKLMCAIIIFLTHIGGPGSTYESSTEEPGFAWISVHIFFMISGFLMVNGIIERNPDPAIAGKFSFNYVINKFKRIAPQYIVAGLSIFAVDIYIYIYIYIINPRFISLLLT